MFQVLSCRSDVFVIVSNPCTPLGNCNTSVRTLSLYLQFYADFVKVSSLCHAFLYDGYTFSCCFDQEVYKSDCHCAQPCCALANVTRALDQIGK